MDLFRRVSLLVLSLMIWASSSYGDEPDKDEITYPYPGGVQADLWLIAGQSNAAGFAIMKEVTKPDPQIMIFCNADKWVVAKEPMEELWFPSGGPHGLVTDHTMKPSIGGVGWGLFFSRHLIKYTKRPIGLIAVGAGHSMKRDWDPLLKDQEEKQGPTYIYDKLVDRVIKVGGYGHLKGMVWYQGESDAVENPSHTKFYEENLLNFVDGIRKDTGNPDLPFIHVQIGRLVSNQFSGVPGVSGGGERLEDEQGTYRKTWTRIREIQRQLADKRENIFMVSAVDLSLDDPIHVAYEGHRKLGVRLAEIALTRVYGMPGHAEPIKLVSVGKPEDVFTEFLSLGKVTRSVIRVRFAGVSGRLHSYGCRPTGFKLVYPQGKSGSVPVIYRVDFDPQEPSEVLVTCTGPLPSSQQGYLYYGAGLNPYVNIYDEKGIPIPAFGPIAVSLD